MRDPHSRFVTVLITLCVALGPLSTDMYLPALPSLTGFFETTTDKVQLTLSVFFLGFAFAQLIYGPLSDRFGRKPLLIIGLSVFMLASIGCVFATSIEQLIFYRFLQAVGGCAGPVLGRTIVRDIHGAKHSAKVLSHIGTAMALAPAIAPILGGYINNLFDWQSIFIFLAVYGGISIALLVKNVPETCPEEKHHSIHPLLILKNFGFLLSHRHYVGYVLTCSFIFSGLFSFLSGSSFVLIEFLGIKSQHFGYYFTGMVFGYMTGTFIAGHLTLKWGINRLIIWGTSISAIAGIMMNAFALLEIYGVVFIIAPMYFFMVGVGIVMPQTMAGALAPFPKLAGTASSLLGFLQSLTAAIVGTLVGHLYTGTPVVMTSSIALMGCLAFISFRFFVSPSKAEAITATT